MLEITSGNFKHEVLEAEQVVVVDFWAPWCMPCKILAPAVEELAKEMAGKVKVAKANVDDSPEIANELSILNIPTLVFFREGKEAARMIGVNSKEAIRSKIEALIG
ncbi:MAG: thioredoxin [Candidatus Omnitrophica bacterium]|nr:thioredoxin [Candidatus Omnitrophota bacterium]